jgi:hypothetical protein
MTFSCLGSCLRYAAALPLVVLLAVCCDPAYAGQPLYAMTDLAPLCATLVGDIYPPSMTGAGIDQNGDITGNLFCTGSGNVYIYDSATDQVRFPVAVGSTVFAINNKQEIAGVVFRAGNIPFIVSGSGEIAIGPAGDENAAFDLNDNSVVVGQLFGHAFKWKAKKLTDLDPELGGQGSTARAINDRNEITGESNAFGAFLLSPTGKVTQLGTLGGSTTAPAAINIYAGDHRLLDAQRRNGARVSMAEASTA